MKTLHMWKVELTDRPLSEVPMTILAPVTVAAAHAGEAAARAIRSIRTNDPTETLLPVSVKYVGEIFVPDQPGE